VLFAALALAAGALPLDAGPAGPASGWAPAAQANAGGTICVALVVDFGDLGGGVDSTCATVHKGATGYDVLHAGGHTFTICPNGVLGSIDGKPADGCSEMKDNKHYWSYWHRAPGGSQWTYSDEGGGSYRPANASTDGWHWMDSPPANVAYDRICKPQPSATPTRAPAPRPTARPPSSRQPASRPARATGATAAPLVVSASARSRARHRTLSATTARAAPSPSPTALASLPRSAAARSSSYTGLVAAIATAVLLVAAAALHRRRRR
jgi:hypothetical protein